MRPRRWVGLALLPALAAAGCFAGAPGALVATAHRCEPVPLARPCAPVPRAPLASSAAPTNHLCVANNYTHCVAMKGGSNFVIDLARNWTRKAAPKLWFDNRPPRLNNTCWNTQSRAAIGDRGSVLVYRNPFVKFMSAVIHKGLKAGLKQYDIGWVDATAGGKYDLDEDWFYAQKEGMFDKGRVSGTWNYKFKGAMWYYTFMPIEGTPYMIALSVEYSEVTATADQMAEEMPGELLEDVNHQLEARGCRYRVSPRSLHPSR